MCGFSSNLNFKLIYQGQRYGFSGYAYYSKVMDKSNLFVIFKSSFGNVFGGYTSNRLICDLESTGSIFDDKSFIFSFVNPHNIKTRMNIQKPEMFSKCTNYFGINFGQELFTYFDSRNRMFGFTKSFGDVYSLPNVSNISLSFLTGTINSIFQITDIEIYQIDCKINSIIYFYLYKF